MPKIEKYSHEGKKCHIETHGEARRRTNRDCQILRYENHLRSLRKLAHTINREHF